MRTIPVRDSNGDELTLYEYRDRLLRSALGLRYVRKVRRMVLCTGEPVDYVNESTFVLAHTGEKLRRIK